MSDVLIKAERVGQTFQNGRLTTEVLFDIDLAIGRGEFVAIMGPSGCGKSTLMHILGLMLSATKGKVYIDGEDTSGLNNAGRALIRREKIGFVFQRFNLLTTIDAYENIAVAERIRGNKPDGQVTRALAAVEMSDRAHYKPGQLSIGQQQRVAIARAISHEPAILLADEPTGNLDSANTEKILSLFRRIHEQCGITIIMVTHSASAAQWADRIIHMADGRIGNIETAAAR